MPAHCTDDGGNKARSPRRARRKPLKPLRREGRSDPPTPVVTSVCFHFLHTDRGCSGHPAFPAPSLEGRARPHFQGRVRPHLLGGWIFFASSGALCREDAEACRHDGGSKRQTPMHVSDDPSDVMAGLRPGHPRLPCLIAVKTWMPATS